MTIEVKCVLLTAGAPPPQHLPTPMGLTGPGTDNASQDLPGGMRTTDMVTISGKGQLVIPSKVRESMAIREKDKFMLVHDRDTILLKRVHEEKLKKRMKELVAKFRTGMEESAISKKDLEAVIRKARKQDA